MWRNGYSELSQAFLLFHTFQLLFPISGDVLTKLKSNLSAIFHLWEGWHEILKITI